MRLPTWRDFLSDQERLENVLVIYQRDILPNANPSEVKKIAALGYDEIIRLRGILRKAAKDRRRQVQARWNRRTARRAARG